MNEPIRAAASNERRPSAPTRLGAVVNRRVEAINGAAAQCGAQLTGQSRADRCVVLALGKLVRVSFAIAIDGGLASIIGHGENVVGDRVMAEGKLAIRAGPTWRFDLDLDVENFGHYGSYDFATSALNRARDAEIEPQKRSLVRLNEVPAT